MRKLPVFDHPSKATRVGHFFKALAGDERSQSWCTKNGIGLQKAGAEFPDQVGGFLTPTDFDAAILRVLEQVGAFRQGAELRPTTSDSQVRPRRTGGVTASFVSEGQVIPESSFLLDAIETSQKKIAILARASSELFEDSAPDLGEFLTREIAYAFAAAEDDCGFNGDGTSTYRGISGLGAKLAGLKSAITAAAGHNTYATVDSTDLANLVAGVIGAAIPGAAWYCSITAYGQTFARLASVSGGLVATKRADGTIDASYLGLPVVFSAKLPDVQSTLAGKPMIYFGDLSMSSLIVERRATIVSISRQRALENDQFLIRGTRRGDIVNHDVGDAATRGPVAVLLGGA
jgi:HK97 family phage major capsid protein